MIDEMICKLVANRCTNISSGLLLPANLGKASALFIPVCQFAVPVDSPRRDAQVPFPSHCRAGVGLTAPHGVNDSALLGRITRCTRPDDLLDVVTARPSTNE